MKNTFYITLFSLVLATLSMGTQCKKEYNHTQLQYQFLTKIDILADYKFCNVGDTIWLQYSNSAKKLYDTKSSKNINLEQVSMGFQIAFVNRLYNSNVVSALKSYCNFVIPDGVSQDRFVGESSTSIVCTFGCNDNYNLLLGIVPKQKGIFSLDLLNIQTTVLDCAGSLQQFPYSIIDFSFNVNDCHPELYDSIPKNLRGDNYSQNAAITSIQNKKTYMLKVE